MCFYNSVMVQFYIIAPFTPDLIINLTLNRYFFIIQSPEDTLAQMTMIFYKVFEDWMTFQYFSGEFCRQTSPSPSFNDRKPLIYLLQKQNLCN